ncbi:DUF2339 domain-containing protein [Paraglaciecola aquimarina]|uniref:DUF2339 domain-containing protein n=1 Tax=Paraglaciecola algarum TaxID=3050085 RepID=A0ABS9D170_9ALTE|nr:DUF2339 domain-containing protein [Paraglaciecola sp. G1-23]MCF2946647.1 DUF2339 domain-containing protein [Paraglaciecola sp. G1-23]
MSSKDSQIDELQRELALTRVEFSTRLQKLEQKIASLTSDVGSPAPETNDTKNQQLTDHFAGFNPDTDKPHTEPKAERQMAATISSASHQTDKQQPKLSAIGSFLKESGQQLISLSSPFTRFLSPLLNLYQHYQAKGQGPIFVFMLIGIVLLVAGFGYLTQLLVGELGAGSQSLLLFIVAIGTTLSGAYLAKKNKYPEFNSAIVGLGLLLNYITVYMAGSFYQLLPDWAVLLSYFAIAGVGFVFANKFDTKTVSALSVIGGAAIPLISQLDQAGTSLYLVGLGFIIMASLYQAINKNWPWLGIVSVFVTYSCLEFLITFVLVEHFIAYFSQGFYCLFLFYLYHFIKLNSQVSKNLIVLSVMILFANIGIFYQSDITNVWVLPTLAIFNTLLSSYLVFKTKTQNSYASSLHTLFASTWMLVAIISWFAPDYWGFAIGIEGLFILYLALKENYQSVRVEAYALLTFAVLHAVFAVLPYFPDPALLTLKGILVVASIGAIIFGIRKLLANHKVENEWEVQLLQALRPIESIWLSLFILSLLWVNLGVWMAVAVLPLQIWLLVKTYRTSCKTSEIMVNVASAVAVGICVLGINEVQSLSFRDLPDYAKVALIFVFAESWLFAEFYRRTKQTGPLANIAENLRLTFYLVLPVTFLPSAIKHYNEFSALAFWVAASIAYLLGRIIKHPFIRTESLIIFAIAALYNLVFTIEYYHSQFILSAIANLIGLGLFSYFLINTHKQHAPLLNKKIASISLYYLAACMAIYMQEWANFVWAGVLACVYIFALSMCVERNNILARNRRILGYLNFFNILISWLYILITGSGQAISSSIWVLISMAISLIFLLKTHALNRLKLALFNDSKTGYCLQSLLLSISGALILIKWDLAILITPWLILHGSYLFFTHKHSQFISKLALVFIGCGLAKLALVDAASAVLWQKVALMISIGIFMLAAAFVYQKRINATIESQNEIV